MLADTCSELASVELHTNSKPACCVASKCAPHYGGCRVAYAVEAGVGSDILLFFLSVCPFFLRLLAFECGARVQAAARSASFLPPFYFVSFPFSPFGFFRRSSSFSLSGHLFYVAPTSRAEPSPYAELSNQLVFPSRLLSSLLLFSSSRLYFYIGFTARARHFVYGVLSRW